jgi:hypothetical protein
MPSITRRQALASTARIAAAAMLPASTRSFLAQTTPAQTTPAHTTPARGTPAHTPASSRPTSPFPADASGISGPGRPYDPANPIEFHHVATGSAVKDGLLPPITPIWDLHLRDTVICLGGDGNYYMTGSSGADIWVHNDGVELWRSADLRKWDYLGLVWNTQRDGHWEKTPMDLHGKPVVTIWAPEIHYIKKNYFICLSMAPAGISILRSTTGKPEGPYRHAFSPEAPIVKAIDPTLFEDEDGKVYFTHSSAKEIYLLKPDLSGFDGNPRPITLAYPDHTPSHHAEKCTPRGSNDLGTEGATLCGRQLRGPLLDLRRYLRPHLWPLPHTPRDRPVRGRHQLLRRQAGSLVVRLLRQRQPVSVARKARSGRY